MHYSSWISASVVTVCGFPHKVLRIMNADGELT